MLFREGSSTKFVISTIRYSAWPTVSIIRSYLIKFQIFSIQKPHSW